MKILVNGNVQELEASAATISGILKQNSVTKPEMVSVQLNEQFVEPAQYETTQLKELDELEFIYFMGGGSSCFGFNK
jgi:sulfur carrier protein